MGYTAEFKGGVFSFQLRWVEWTTLAWGFLDCEDVPDITAVAKAASVRWDPISCVVVSTEPERRFLYGEERRRQGRVCVHASHVLLAQLRGLTEGEIRAFFHRS